MIDRVVISQADVGKPLIEILGSPMLTGSTTFYKLSCVTPDKQISVAVGANITVKNEVELTGL